MSIPADVTANFHATHAEIRSCSVKAKIHPRYVTSHVRCACGNEFVTRSTQPKIGVDICSACHPLFTGKQKFVDTAGRVERFSKKFGGTYSFQKTAAPAAAVKK
jgi:large subunit ribosomal protein L31